MVGFEDLLNKRCKNRLFSISSRPTIYAVVLYFTLRVECSRDGHGSGAEPELEMARADFFDAQTAHGPEPLAQ